MIKKNFLMKLLIILAFSLILFYPTKILASEHNPYNVVLFINQVRGNECCQAGKIENLEKQINTFKENNLSANFNLRYDALGNSEYQNLLKSLDKNQFEIGAFLEIIPSLAKDSRVEYLADETNWSQAHHAYTVGYNFEDRKKIIDTYMNKFHEVFGYYPKTTTAWIMDTNSLNYLKEKYKVESHQITREQWGTDSYTLSGGPIHYPYFANSNWAFIPTDESNSDDKLLILRQTGSDPLFNYGDTSNAFTTQPNDYALDGKNINYFKKLSKELLFEQKNSSGFLLLGIENSMEDNFQNDYIEQIKIISGFDGVESLTANNFKQKYSQQIIESKVNTVMGNDLVTGSDTQSLWINTNKYRARLLFKNNQIQIDDLRIYDQELQDPYNSLVAQKYAYWITPFILDGSRFFEKNQVMPTDIMSKLRLKYLPELMINNLELKTVHNDVTSSQDALVLPFLEGSVYTIRQDSDSVNIEYISTQNNQENIKFYSNYFVTPLVESKNFRINLSNFLKENNDGIFFSFDNQDYYGLSKNCSDKCIFSSSDLGNELFTSLREKYYYLLFPEIRTREIDTNESIFYAHNKYTIQGKNPIRFIFMPRDSNGLPTIPTGELKVNFSPDISETQMHPPEGNGTQFFDVYAKDIGKHELDFAVDGIQKQEEIFFAPNCKEQIGYCIFHPRQTIWYLKSMFYTKLRDF